MDGEEESSWLSIVIDQVDKLALRIGGYEDEAPENIFSDDESDNANSNEEDEESGDSGFEDATNNEDDDDSGFEDAIASPGRPPIGRPRAENRVKAPEAKDGGSGGEGGALAEMQQEASCERLPLMSGVDKAPSVSVPPTRSSEVHLDLADVQASEAPHDNPGQELRRQLAASTASSADKTPSVSVTPSNSQDHFDEDGIPAVERAPLKQQGSAGGDFNSTFSTPAHSRDRNASNRPPPLAAGPSGSGAGSRRVHRYRHRSREDLDATPTEGMPTAEVPAPVHASSSPTASPRLETVNRSRETTKSNKYLYASDNTWLKPKVGFPEPAPSLLELGTVGVPGECSPIQRNTNSTPAEESSASGSAAVPFVGTAGDTPALAERRNRDVFPCEAEHQLGHNVPAEAIAEAETDSRLSKDNKSADNSGMNEEMGAQAEEIASGCSENGLALAESPNLHLAEDRVGANDHDAPHEENGAIQIVGAGHEGDDPEEAHGDGEEPREEEVHGDAVGALDIWTEGVVTIGAKRASVGNGLDTQDLDWILDSPEGLAPSKRGRTQPEQHHHLAVMRHSARLDDAIHERQRKRGAVAAGSGSERLENGEGGELAAIPWPDKALRPYDSPIVDTGLPARQAKELSRLGMGSETLIVCSPFRRCLQTAGVVARTLGVASVTVHLGVGERMDKVRKEIAELALVNEQESDGGPGSQPTPVFSYLGEEAMCEALGAGVKLKRIVGEQPPHEESGVEAKRRFIATIAKIREENLRESPVLVVAHGDTLDAAGESLASQIVFEADYCAWALFKLDSRCGYVTESYGIQMIPL